MKYFSILAWSTMLSLLGPAYALAQDAVWHEQRFQHKEEPRGGGGTVMWRDSFKKEGFQIYDFVIEVHSVRGGGSEFASYTTDGVLKVFAAKTGIPFDKAAKQYTEQLKQRESTTPYIRIFNDSTIVVQGKTVYGTLLGDAGGNVEYTIRGLFVRNMNVVGIPGRFAFAGFTDLAMPAARAKIDENFRGAVSRMPSQPPAQPSAGGVDPPEVRAIHRDEASGRHFHYYQTGGPKSFLNCTRADQVQIHVGKLVSVTRVGSQDYCRYLVEFSQNFSPSWVLTATAERRYEVWFPKNGRGIVYYSSDNGKSFVRESDVPPAGLVSP